MPKKLALVSFPLCHPEHCEGGVCAAALACPRHLLTQERPGQTPMPNPAICRGCADCVRACPMKAISIVSR